MEGLGLPIRLMQRPDEDEMNRQMEEREAHRRKRFPYQQARAMLTEALQVLETVHEFEHGQFVWYKRGVESSRLPPCGNVAVFLRYQPKPADVEPFEISQPVALWDVDCVIGVLLPNGAMAEYFCCSRYLEPAPEQVPEDEETTVEKS